MHQPRFFTGARNPRGLKDVSWHGTRVDQAGWNDPDARVLGFTLAGFDDDADLHIMMNMHWTASTSKPPALMGLVVAVAVDTSASLLADVADEVLEAVEDATALNHVPGRTIVRMISKRSTRHGRAMFSVYGSGVGFEFSDTVAGYVVGGCG